MFYKLFKIFASNIFSVSSYLEGFKKGWKGIIKNVLLLLLLIYCYSAFAAMYVFTMHSTYKYLAASGSAFLMPVISLVLVLCVILFFGITSVATNYYTGHGEEQFIAMPITSAQLFGAKFAVSFCTDAIIGFVLFAISSFIYGYNEHLLCKPLFYAGFIITDFAVSLVAISIIYVLLIFILWIFPVLRKKSFLTAIASIMIFIFAISYGLVNSKVSGIYYGDTSQLSALSVPIAGFALEIKQKLPFVTFFAQALDGKILPILVFALLCAAIIFGLIPLMGKFYLQTLNGFSDIKTKKLSRAKAEAVLQKSVHTSSVFKALYVRDVRTVLREPTFFANGPLMVFLLPVIMMISTGLSLAGTSSKSLGEFRSGLEQTLAFMSQEQFMNFKHYAKVILTGLALFNGNITNIASSSFSREGKGMYDLKAMPLHNLMIAKVKFWHAMTYNIISFVMLSGVLIGLNYFFGLPLSAGELLGIIGTMVITVTPVAVLLIFIEMFIDTAKPKLLWENPIAAFKQNMNTAISVFVVMATGMIAVLPLVFLPKSFASFAGVAVVFALIAAPVGYSYFRYAEKQISRM